MKLGNSNLFQQACLVNGAWVQATDGSSFDVINPFDHSRLGTVPLLSARDTQHAIEAAEKAWPAWRNMTAKERTI